ETPLHSARVAGFGHLAGIRMSEKPPQDSAPALESTAALLAQVRAGDAQSRERLCRRYLPMLRAWAHGRLPPRARGLADTDDLARAVLRRALGTGARFEPRREGAFLAYLRRILLNAIRDELRRSVRRPSDSIDPAALPAADASPLERAIGADVVESYEA